MQVFFVTLCNLTSPSFLWVEWVDSYYQTRRIRCESLRLEFTRYTRTLSTGGEGVVIFFLWGVPQSSAQKLENVEKTPNEKHCMQDVLFFALPIP